MKTFMAKPSDVYKKWFLVDATDMPLGRLASQVAAILRGKNKPIYTPHVDTGDYVIVINCDKVILTGNKLLDKKYTYHTGFIGGLKQVGYKSLILNKSEKAVLIAVKGMLPKTRLGKKMINKLKLYKGSEHKHEAQQPTPITLKGGKNNG